MKTYARFNETVKEKARCLHGWTAQQVAQALWADEKLKEKPAKVWFSMVFERFQTVSEISKALKALLTSISWPFLT